MKVSNFFKYISVFLLLYFFGIEGVQAQQNKLLHAKSNFNTSFCVTPNYNGKVIVTNPDGTKTTSGFRVKVRWSPPLPNADNKYIFELSDANGSFNNPTVLPYETDGIPKGKTINNVLFFDAYLTFPKTLNGKKYRIRLRSTNPASEVIVIGELSGKEEFEGNFINATGSVKTVPSGNVNLCPGQTTEISVTQIFTTASNNISDYNYVWYKSDIGGNNSVRINGQTGPKITVSEEGTYRVYIDYGACTNSDQNISKSNNINVRIKGGGQSLVLSSSATEICSSESFTLTATPAGTDTYSWYRDNTKLGETNGVATYVVSPPNNLPGKYRVQIGDGGGCGVRSNEIEIKHKDAIKANITTTGGNVLLPNKQRTLSVNTTAQNPSYKWFKDGVEIPGQTANTYVATSAGKYKAQVTQTGSCASTVETEEYELKAPDSFKVSIKPKTSYQPCETNSIDLTVDKITAVSGATELAIDPSDYSFFTFQWQRETGGAFTDINTTQEITLNSATQNGKYRLKITASGFPAIPESNVLDIQLQDSNALRINNSVDNVDFCGEVYTLTVTTGADPTATYTWFKDRAQIAQGVGMTQYGVTATGVYYATIGGTGGGCPATSNSVVAKRTVITARWAEDMNTREIYYPAKTTVLKISHNMTNPTVEWKKNGTVIAGVTGVEYTVTDTPVSADVYEAKITDGGSCGTSINLTPIYFETIADIKGVRVGTVASTNCETRTQTTLEVQKITVQLSSSGEQVEVKKIDYQFFNFQWQKDSNDVPGETRQQFVVSRAGNSESAKYSVRVSYGTIIKTSDEKPVAFTPIPDFEISSADGAKGTVYLCQGGTISLTVAADSFDPNSSVADSFSYVWKKITSANYTNDTPIGSENPTASVNEIGEYYLEINNGGCPKRAHIQVKNYQVGGLKLSLMRDSQGTAPVKQVYQTSTARERKFDVRIGDRLVAEGGNKFSWTKDDGTVKYGTTLEVTSEDMSGSYTLKEESCVVAGENILPFELNIYQVVEVPNVVTPNGDGINDKWEIPSVYLTPKVKVTIYSQEGKEVLSTNNYQNNWPDERTFNDLGKRALIYIYTLKGEITENGDTRSVDKKGTITIFK
ncbi:gliding motility-associated C-terminal domain-containing protein [Capnocytophaga ochracea]|uniref:Gliding motility-associated C-terminal domain n=1 Tax=Capnocytophaga ochracea TaxID=1018 RepID=A0A2X2STN3_CAPOC|nr:gliding motility-associated C-terminal domain-containing protein [Capnocytophaga ochracea]SQA95254.1 gliding motility-associated C-terminal domain [Capnocytophaga ochracea]